jgi:uncharacterized protein (DUF2062 family)
MIHLTRSLVRKWLESLLHIHDSPRRTASAYALGVFWGFSPFFGLHTVLGLACAFVFSLNRVAVVLGVYSNLPWIIVPYYTVTTMAAAEVLGVHMPADFAFQLRRLFDLSFFGSAFWTDLARLLAPLVWPFTLGELHGQGNTLPQFREDPLRLYDTDHTACQATLQRLTAFSGFPEPYLAGKEMTYRRWSRTYHRQLIREDIRDVTAIKNIDDVEILFHLLPSKVGAPLSIPSLATDLKVAYNTTRNWLSILERFYLTFTLSPWTTQIARTLHKERKTYLFDYAQIEDEAARFENLVALELFRAVSNWNDMGYGDYGLHFIRTKEGREVDFLLSEGNHPILLLEAKRGDDTPAANLKRFQAALGVPAVQLLGEGEGFKRTDHAGHPLLVVPAAWWLPGLP